MTDGLLDEGNADGDDDDDTVIGVPSSYEDLYRMLVFFTCLYLAGDVICRQWLRIIPSLVGHIAVGMALGPQGLGIVPVGSETTWVLLGNVGLVLLTVQAGLEMDLATLHKIGPRGVWIAIVGSILPISFGTLAAHVILQQPFPETSLAVGCCFGPTSAGIALNVLGNELLATDLGQLIVAAAIVDDMLALVVLSQLRALTTTTNENIDVAAIVVPIVSAIVWLLVGGAIALYVMPYIMKHLKQLWTSFSSCWECDSDDTDRDDKRSERDSDEEPKNPGGTHKNSRSDDNLVSWVAAIVLLMGLLPATNYSQASYLLGAFLTGLSFCHQKDDDDEYNNNNSQDQDSAGAASFSKSYEDHLDGVIEWLMKLFFAATIGFQVPPLSILFGDIAVVWKGIILYLLGPFLGKLAVGFLLTPQLHHQKPEDIIDLTSSPSQPTSLQQDQGTDSRNDNREVMALENDDTEAATSSTPTSTRNATAATAATASTTTQSLLPKWQGLHLRDCAIVGCSMGGEAEFAFVIAVFGISEGLLDKSLYASVVLAILLSAVVSPLLLRTIMTVTPKV